MYLSGIMWRRQAGNGNPSGGSGSGDGGGGGGGGISTGMIIAVVFVILFIVALTLVLNLRKRRQKKMKGGADYENLSARQTQAQRILTAQPSVLDAALSATLNSNTSNNGTDAAGVNRNTSVRSVMTLPAYNPKPYDTEQVLGREGERGGMDSVLEYPDHEAEELRREEEMEALYQVRLARRTEIQERNERRRLRAAAREANDHVALRRLREQEQERDRTRAEGNAASTIEQLRAEVERAKTKPRAVSSVSYGDLGVARHDGTRLRIGSNGNRQRAGSVESERQGLLGEAADMAESLRSQHGRTISNGSIASIDTYNSNDFPLPHLTRSRSRSNSRPGTPLRINTATSTNTTIAEADLGLERIDVDANRALSAQIESPSPPGYENVTLGSPPGYTSPIAARNSQRFSFPQNTAYYGASQRQETSSEAGTSRSGEISTPTTSTRIESPAQSSTSSRGVGGTPQLPSLRLSNLPSIVVNEASSRSPT